MKKVIMVREKIFESKDYLIDPETMQTGKEIWHHIDDDPYWNEYYRVAVFDDEKYYEEWQALISGGADFYNFVEAKEYYDKLKQELA